MPIILSGIWLAISVACVVHAVRAGRVMPWIYVIVFLPGIGTAAYVIAELIPSLLGSRGVRRLGQKISDMADPGRGLREAKDKSEIIGSAESKHRLAQEHLARREFGPAIALYEEALTGAHADDPMLLTGLANAWLASGDGARAQMALDKLREANPEFQSPDAHMIYAHALELQENSQAALDEYEALVVYFPGEEARWRYANLLSKCGKLEDARRILQEVLARAERGPGHYRRAQKAWVEAAKRDLAKLPT